MKSLEILEYEYKQISNSNIGVTIKEYNHKAIDELLVAIIELKEFNKLKVNMSYFIKDWIRDNYDSYLKGNIDNNTIEDAKKCILFLDSLNRDIK